MNPSTIQPPPLAELPPLAMVAAMTLNRVIGLDGGMPWHLPEDLKHFRRVTTGHAVIMGRRTFDEIGRPLPKRRNIVVSRQVGLSLEGCEVFNDLWTAVAAARRDDDEPRIIGGGTLYTQALPRATRIYLTEIQQTLDGDTYFPEFDERDWRETERRESEGLIFRTLDRMC